MWYLHILFHVFFMLLLGVLCYASAWPETEAEVAETISLERFLDSWYVNGCTGSTEIWMKRHLHPEFS